MKNKIINLVFLISIFSVISCDVREIPTNEAGNLTEVSLRLQWIGQAQFAGFIVAKKLGYYEQVGIDARIRSGGPDLKPHLTVASGTDDFGVGVSNQIILANSNGVPLVVTAQLFQDSANRYVLKSENSIESLKELKDKKIGLWLGGDEAEFFAMLENEGMTETDVQIIPQGFSVIPFIKDEYTLSQVTVYNELRMLKEKLGESALQIIGPSEFNSAIPGDLLFTSRDYLRNNPDIVENFTNASIRGWKYSVENPEEAARIIVESYPDLDFQDQLDMLKSLIPIILKDVGINEIGAIDYESYSKVQTILLSSGQMSEKIDLNKMIYKK